MKSYTDLEQSRKLAQILPLESADMNWHELPSIGFFARAFSYKRDNGATEGLYPCWSLAALLDVLPNEISTGEEWHNKYQIDIRKYDGVDNTTWYQIAYGNNRGSSGSWHDMINTGERQNLIDCCVDMVLLCKKHNWL